MKRSRSSSGGARKKQQQQTKFRYELVRYNEKGELFDLTAEELQAFKERNASFVSKWMAGSGEEDTSWQAQCRRVLEYIMVRPPTPYPHFLAICGHATRMHRGRAPRRRTGSCSPSTRRRSA